MGGPVTIAFSSFLLGLYTSMFGCQAFEGCLPEVARVMRGNAWHKVGISRPAEPLRVSRQR